MMRSVAVVCVLLFQASRAFVFQDAGTCNTTWMADVPPPLRPGETLETRLSIDHVLETYWNKGNPYGVSQDKREYTYGEVTILGGRQLLHAMGLYQRDSLDKIVLYDLGSGAGKFVAQALLEERATKVVGIELSTERHDIAIDSWKALQEDLDLNKEGVHFYNQDFLETDLTDATHVYVCSLCLPSNVLEALQGKLLTLSTRLEVVAALSDLRRLQQHGWHKTTQDVQMTWGRAQVRLYTPPGP